MSTNLRIRFAQSADAALILRFIRALAEFEEPDAEITATEEDIRVSLFERRQAEAILGEAGGEPAAFALFFSNYSTFLGRANLYLEDLFVREEYRGRGIGKAMLGKLAQIAAERGCERLDWLCLDRNGGAAAFYKSLGAQVIDDRRVFRISGERLKAFAHSQNL